MRGAVTRGGNERAARRRGVGVRDENAIRDPLLRSRAMGISKLRYKGRFEEISRSTARWTKTHPYTKEVEPSTDVAKYMQD